MTLRTKLSIVLLALSALATACMWDRDTLAEETKGKMDVMNVIVGRFERNPPLYFQMRLERVTKEIAQDPTKLNLYDDAGVASDRLGKHSDAIAWMERKAAAMKKGAPSNDDRYRYYANLGTFYAHRWSDKKAGEAKPGDLDQGISIIRKAIEINPNAHFGREKYQLAILEWMKTRPSPEPLASGQALTPLSSYLESMKLLEWSKKGAQGAITGLAGLVKLGNAWESVDVFAALADSLAFGHDGTTGEAAMARVRELIAAGKTSLSGWKPPEGFELTGGPDPFVKEQARSEFSRLRREADKWHQARMDFMNRKLNAGLHPDMNPDFWEGYEETPMEVRDIPFWKKPDFLMGLMIAAGILVLIAIPTVPILIVVWIIRRKKRQRPAV